MKIQTIGLFALLAVFVGVSGCQKQDAAEPTTQSAAQPAGASGQQVPPAGAKGQQAQSGTTSANPGYKGDGSERVGSKLNGH